jgi:hypothetical protein
MHARRARRLIGQEHASMAMERPSMTERFLRRRFFRGPPSKKLAARPLTFRVASG